MYGYHVSDMSLAQLYRQRSPRREGESLDEWDARLREEFEQPTRPRQVGKVTRSANSAGQKGKVNE